MKKLLVFGASNSSTSINKEFASYSASLLNNVTVDLIDLNDFEMPIFSVDREKENGIPPLANAFKSHIAQSDAILISFAEHNGNVTAAYKNIFDWISRIEKNVWLDKPMLLLSTSPGARGAKTTLDIVSKAYSYSNKSAILTFSLPSFYENYDKQKGITSSELKEEHEKIVLAFSEHLKD